MKEIFKPNTDEREGMIIAGIILLYLLIVGFIIFLYLLHRISLMTTTLSAIIFTLIYIPRLLIINKLRQKDKIIVMDSTIRINNIEIPYSEIKNYRVKKNKPVVVFVFNNNLIIYQEAEFRILTNRGEIFFTAIGREKIELLAQYLKNLNE